MCKDADTTLPLHFKTLAEALAYVASLTSYELTRVTILLCPKYPHLVDECQSVTTPIVLKSSLPPAKAIVQCSNPNADCEDEDGDTSKCKPKTPHAPQKDDDYDYDSVRQRDDYYYHATTSTMLIEGQIANAKSIVVWEDDDAKKDKHKKEEKIWRHFPCCCLLSLEAGSESTLIDGIEFRNARFGSALVFDTTNLVVNNSRFIANRNGIRVEVASQNVIENSNFLHQRTGIQLLDRIRLVYPLYVVASRFQSLHVGITFERDQDSFVATVCPAESPELPPPEELQRCIDGELKTAPLRLSEGDFRGGYQAGVLMRGVSSPSTSNRVVITNSLFFPANKPFELTPLFQPYLPVHEQRRSVAIHRAQFVTVEQSRFHEAAFFVSKDGEWLNNIHSSPRADWLVLEKDKSSNMCPHSLAPHAMTFVGNDFCGSNGALVRDELYDSTLGPLQPLVLFDENYLETMRNVRGPDNTYDVDALELVFSIGALNKDCDTNFLNFSLSHEDKHDAYQRKYGIRPWQVSVVVALLGMSSFWIIVFSYFDARRERRRENKQKRRLDPRISGREQDDQPDELRGFDPAIPELYLPPQGPSMPITLSSPPAPFQTTSGATTQKKRAVLWNNLYR